MFVSRNYIFFAFVSIVALMVRREGVATVVAVLLPVGQEDGRSIEGPAQLIWSSRGFRGWLSSGWDRQISQDHLVPAHSISRSWMSLTGKVASLADTRRG